MSFRYARIGLHESISQIEHGSCRPLLYTTSGGMSKECGAFYGRVVELLAEKRGLPKSMVSNWIRTRISFSLVRSMNLCIRGSRSLKRKAELVADTDIDIFMARCDSDR